MRANPYHIVGVNGIDCDGCEAVIAREDATWHYETEEHLCPECEKEREPEPKPYNGGGWPGDGSGTDDLADHNQNEADDYRNEGEGGDWCDHETEAERNT